MKKAGFDFVVHRMNKKGQITHVSPYRLVIENGVEKYERPPGSGYFYSKDGAMISAPKVDKKKAKEDLEEAILEGTK